jgi:peptidoglycan/LPS O-acetylase OafA/YrhL
MLPYAALIGITGMLACGSQISYPFLHNGLLDILFAVLIYGLAREGAAGHHFQVVRLLSMPALVLLGEASYALYILHVPLRTWMYKVLEWFHPGVQPSMPLFAAYTIFTVGISILVFKIIEEPARRMIRRRLTPAVPSLAS